MRVLYGEALPELVSGRPATAVFANRSVVVRNEVLVAFVGVLWTWTKHVEIYDFACRHRLREQQPRPSQTSGRV